ncbi:hypothetical protein DICPUDRAFT_77737 [Dictyostelium purpureum]|uniref:Zinc-ribbon domain-containing protein n=1 Tax=Dictyostelium purpureum TaxID=5786 RepID=F0ZHG8_DICPU|nr:uncharacterized protein DICPUDRAFT_77737 [Dictyostelium purpureum]EGC36627.1 hypothetical protein DICPUDRAFT_77737 [Dictyostelium purpureum]|eukprot:XP_003286865.1 hypothetical protein DICPUDRAFT_77737 [Dictyostelium purpureum]
MSTCPYCNKKVYFAERQFYKNQDYHQICHGLLIREEQAKAPKVFAIHEIIHCNPDENLKQKYPLAPIDGYVPSQPSTSASPPPKTVKERLNTVSSVDKVVSTPSGFNSSGSKVTTQSSSPSSSPKVSTNGPKKCGGCPNILQPNNRFCTQCGLKC